MVAVKRRSFTDDGVRLLVENGLAGLDPLAVGRCVDDMVRSVEELLDRLVKKARIALVDVEFDGNGTTDLDESSQYTLCC